MNSPAPGLCPTEMPGFVPDRYMPVRKAEIVSALTEDPRLDDDTRPKLAKLARSFAKLFHLEYFNRRETLKDLYVALNPDQPGKAPLVAPDEDEDKLLAEFRAACDAANFTELSRDEVAAAETRMGRVRAKVKVPWELYEDIRFFVRGRQVSTIRWTSMFGLRKHQAEMITYDQVVLYARVRQNPRIKAMKRAPLRPGGLYLKLFRDIPEADLNTLFPNGKVMIGLLDQALIAVPALVGGIPILLNLLPALSVLFVVVAAYLGFQGAVDDDHVKKALAAMSGLAALIGFLMRQWVKYERQALKYQKQVSDNAYFKNLNNNAAFFDFIIGTSEDSEVKEAILAYFFLLIADGPVTRPELDRLIEDWLTQRFGVTVDFDIDDALHKLERFGIASEDEAGISIVPIDTALTRSQEAWNAMAAED